MTNYYPAAIRALATLGDSDYKEILFDIASRHPKMVADAINGAQTVDHPPETDESFNKIFEDVVLEQAEDVVMSEVDLSDDVSSVEEQALPADDADDDQECDTVERECLDLCADKKYQLAVKHYREQKGVSHNEAKEAVDRLRLAAASYRAA